VLLCAVAFVASKSVAGIKSVKFHHDTVSGDLGYDRSTGNGETQFVASGYSPLRYGTLRQGYSINNEEVRSFGQFFHCLHHSQLGRFEDVDGVDYLMGNDADAYSHSLFANKLEERFSFLRV
jgi:hypothetical protein